MSYSYRDRQGNEISLMDWAEKYEDFEYKSVAVDTVGDVRVQTVWCGHWDDPAAPMYGTALLDEESRKMVREVPNPALTDEGAVAEHRRIVEELRAETQKSGDSSNGNRGK